MKTRVGPERRRRTGARGIDYVEEVDGKAQGEAAERRRDLEQGRAESLAERVMAAKCFEYWVRR